MPDRNTAVKVASQPIASRTHRGSTTPEAVVVLRFSAFTVTDTCDPVSQRVGVGREGSDSSSSHGDIQRPSSEVHTVQQ